jgi:hypothetical protein
MSVAATYLELRSLIFTLEYCYIFSRLAVLVKTVKAGVFIARLSETYGDVQDIESTR